MTPIERGLRELFGVLPDNTIGPVPNLWDFRATPMFSVNTAAKRAGIPASDLRQAAEAYCLLHGRPDPQEPCPECKGNRYVTVYVPRQNGYGQTRVIEQEVECDHCNGTGTETPLPF